MKDLYVPENIVGEVLHSCKYFRGICKSIKNDIFGLENNLYLHYSHKGVIVRVEETISKLQNWQIWGEHSPVIYPNVQFFTHNIIMGPPSKWSYVWIMKVGINCKIKCCTLGCLQNYPCNFCMTFVQKDKTAMFDLEIDSNFIIHTKDHF